MILEVTNLRHDFATPRGPLHAVRGVDLRVGPGETLAIVAESGSPDGSACPSGPVLTMLAIDLGYFLGGAVLIESVFSWPGIGLTSFQALRQNDIPLLMGCVVVGSVFLLVLNLVADLIRLRVDPRVSV